MRVELYINDQLADLEEQSFTYNLQVNNFFDFETRQSNYSENLKLPATPTNRKIFELVEISDTPIPYQKLSVDYIVNGIPIVQQGWGVLKGITESGHYSFYFIDGLIDFFTALDDKTFGADVDISELNHIKTPQYLIDSFDSEIVRYIVNDYGGKTELPVELNYYTNIDFMIPSVSVFYLFQKIMQSLALNFDGSIFSNSHFTDGWITYPTGNMKINEINYGSLKLTELPPIEWPFVDTFYFIEELDWWEYINPSHNIPFNEPNALVNVIPVPNRISGFNFPFKGFYNIKLNLNVTAQYTIRINPFQTTSEDFPVKIRMYKNGASEPNWEIISGEGELTIPMPIELGDLITFRIIALNYSELGAINPVFGGAFPLIGVQNIHWSDFEVKITKIEIDETDFNTAFKDLNPKEFVKEFLWRFGLTPIKVKDSVSFYTDLEMLDISKAVDWSDKYVRTVTEEFTVGDFAKKNNFKHKYSEEDADYDDGHLIIENENLPEKKDVITSKLYAPDQNEVLLKYSSGSLTITPCQVWTKEIEEQNGEVEVKYKENSNRFFWQQSVRKDSTIIFASSELGDSVVANKFWYSDVEDTTFRELVPQYYSGVNRVLNKCRVCVFDILLNEMDISKIDFSKPIYIRQKAAYYKLNKVKFKVGSLAEVEAIKINL